MDRQGSVRHPGPERFHNVVHKGGLAHLRDVEEPGVWVKAFGDNDGANPGL